MEKLKKIPSLRFSEFDGEWENKKFSEIVKINQGLQIPISERYLQQVENSYFYVYIDDIIVCYSQSFSNHLNDIFLNA